ncbi:MAG: peptidase domain-containing ABC transporter [Elusimicrobia bacterium]|nr:peptidase domain-containing ABC transporter [Elusimicrobiota bacterium]
MTTEAKPIQEEILAALSTSPLFAIFDKDTSTRVAGRFKIERFVLGDDIIRRGDPGDSLFIIYAGEVRVLGITADGREITLSTLGRGEFFGEKSLLTGEPRQATVRASGDVTLLKLESRDFQEILGQDKTARAYFDRYIVQTGIRNFIRQFTVFSTLTTKELRTLLDHLEMETCKKGEAVFHEGDAADKFYVILKGQAGVFKKNGGEPLDRLTGLGEGKFFGELALLSDQPRAATVIAESDLELAVLRKDHFLGLLQKSEKLQEKLRNVMGLYASGNGHVGELPSSEKPKDSQADAVSRSPGPSAQETNEAAKPFTRSPRRFPWIAQQDETDCGAACLAMISRHYGKRFSVTRLRDLCNVGREGATLLSVSAAAECLGFQTRGVRTAYDLLRQADLPAIAHWQGYHFVVVFRMTETETWLADPGVGIRRMTRAEFEAGWTRMALLMAPTPDFARQPEKKTVLARFLPLLAPHRIALSEALGCALLMNLFGLATPLFIQTIVDRVVVHQDMNLLTLLLTGMLLVSGFQVVTSALRQYLLAFITNRLDLTLLTHFFRHLFELPLRFFHVRKVGDILARVHENSKIREMLTHTLVSSLLDVLMVTIYIGVMLFYNAKLTAVSLGMIPVVVGLTLYFTPLMKRVSREVFGRKAEADAYLVEAIGGVATVKAASAERPVRWKWEDLFVRYVEKDFKPTKLQMGMEASGSVLNSLSTVLLLWYGALLVMKGEMSIGQLMAFNTLIGNVIQPVVRLIGLYDKFQEFLIAVERLNDVFDSTPEQDGAKPNLIRPSALKGRIAFENVSFAYDPASAPVLKNITFETFPGQMIALVGRSGSGKTTLSNLILRFYAPTGGRILLDEFDLQDYDLPALRRQIGVVLQENFLFSGTIRENIALGNPDAPFAEIVESATLAAAHDFITKLPSGYDTLVGERGSSLSGGQRQRIAIARALLSRPKVLIFDEATSALDNESERAIQRNMAHIMKGRTVLVIAHRLSTVQNADQILVLDQGIIVERGKHPELMAQQGLYYYLNNQNLYE